MILPVDLFLVEVAERVFLILPKGRDAPKAHALV
jgi:hypothetical protein